MENPRELQQRIRTIRNIERTVDALQKISAARLARCRAGVATGRPHTDALVDVVRELAATGDYSHPLLNVREGEGDLLLFIGADRGMCGAYNSNLLRAGAEFIATRHREKLYLLTAGRQLRRFRPRTEALILRETLRYPRPMPEEYVTRLAEDITNVYLSGDAVRVYFIFTEFRSATGNRPVVRRVLPLMPRPEKTGRQWLLEPSTAAVLDRLLPLYMTTVVREAFLEADASENAARMVTMEQAALSCRDMISSMALTANRLRQARITRELTDIVGTTEALT